MVRPSAFLQFGSGRRRRRGFVLLMSLVLIALAAVLLASIARHSLLLAVEAHDARLSLQQRWGTASLSRAVLGRAQAILDRRGNAGSKPIADQASLYPAAYQVRLGGLDYELLLDEECRKLNLNRLYMTGGSEQVLKAFRSLRLGILQVRLRPHLGDPRNPATQAFDSWGQVFGLEELSAAEHPAAWLMDNTRQVTCWGAGRVHYRKSEDKVLETIAREVAGPVTAAHLIDLRRRNPDLKLDELLDQLALREIEKTRLRDWLTDQSTCFSLWVTVKGAERPHYALMLTEGATGDSSRIHRFTW